MVDVKQIKSLLKSDYKIKGKVHIDPQTGVVDVMGSVQVNRMMPEFSVQFGIIQGDFKCGSRGLHTLKGAPHTVMGDFECNHNQLTTLEHGPTRVDGNYFTPTQPLKSLLGAPRKVGGDFWCGWTQLTDLTGAPDHVDQDFICTVPGLISLRGAPGHVGGIFKCVYEPHLPLLRMLVSNNPQLEPNFREPEKTIEVILKKHAGEGKKGALTCAVELIKAGFKENARW